MSVDRRNFLKRAALGGWAPAVLSSTAARIVAGQESAGDRTIPIALIQFDAVPEQVERNVGEVERLSKQAVSEGAQWLMFHEGTLCDYTPRLSELAETIPGGRSTRRIEELARRLKCFISFGLSEVQEDRYYITQVFVGPSGFLYRYRKTWLWREPSDLGYRNEWIRYDPGTGPETFVLDGVKATCFICADGEAPRCIERAAKLAPRVVFYPNNREGLPQFGIFGERARAIGAPMLVTNRIGASWHKACKGGCVVYSAQGEVLAKANREGAEEILIYELKISSS